jgi:DNA-binding NtrC family response regulator
MSKILVIDDDEMMLQPLSIYLDGSGFTVLSTADGPQGIMIYKRERPDVVVLDLGLPTMDGLEVLKQIRNYDPVAKVIIATGYGSPKTMGEAMNYGAFAFIDKPFDIEALIELIKSAMNSTREKTNR